MSKVKVTQEQARIIQEFKIRQKEHFEKTKKDPLKYRVSDREMCLFDLDADEFIDAISNGYEVDPEFKAGDYVINHLGTIGRIQSIKNGRCFGKWLNSGAVDNNNGMRDMEIRISGLARHATEKEVEEIKQEQQRRLWDKHGREVYEVKANDLLDINDEFLSIREFYGDEVIFENNCTEDREHLLLLFENGNAEIVCFAEDRKDV